MADGSARANPLDALFRPRSVAVIGASSDPLKIGGLPVSFLKTQGYAGRILPINPKSPEIQGLRAWASLREAPGPVDLAIIAVPAALAEGALEDCAAAGVKGAVMFTSGFAEIDAGGAEVQARMAAAAKAAGVRLLGPNCLGFMNIAERIFATFAPVVNAGVPPLGRIGLVSQSGAFGGFAYSLARGRGLGLSHWITTGNEADLGFAECVEWLAGDPATDVIVGYMEGCRDGARLRRALEACRAAGKPVIVTKVGRSEAGAAAAASHTAALAGEDAVFDGVFRQYGAHRAGSIEECLDIAYAATTAGPPRGRRAGLYTVSGGAGVLMADAASAAGLEVPELTAETQAAVRALVPFAGTRNPLDITGQVIQMEGAFRASLAGMAADGTCDLVVNFLSASGLSPATGPQIAADIAAVRAATPEVPHFLVTLASPEFRAVVEAAGCPIYDDPGRAVRAAAALAGLAEAFARPAPPDPVPGAPGLSVPPDCDEPTALEALAALGLPTAAFRRAATAEEAGEAVAAFGAPCVVKIVSPDLAHKTEVGGVTLNVSGAEAGRAAASAILASAAKAAPGARLRGLMVAPMRRGVAECVIGVQRDPSFGPVVMFGLGGVHVEALRDVTFRAAPFDEAEAMRMIGEVRALRLLTHPRGAPPADLPALARLLAQVSRVAAASPGLDGCDMNPVLALPEGEGAVILDAVLIGG
ncbi:Acyl-CoA synthetase (NDP forming) [Albimonas donghaensis]|uniref:Acyl-CoA synthetase (NDP forming) n=1 Tax=Albimonas donghaensis TaxID=356660 RepID=A0A1H2R356_9RHOB|nr:acetate--CoA ligase family protein [Albimonas donghaensis]SDW13638.1 Acyl-CoA synthetase (NDP forming) [Albimonas donghaensis]